MRFNGTFVRESDNKEDRNAADVQHNVPFEEKRRDGGNRRIRRKLIVFGSEIRTQPRIEGEPTTTGTKRYVNEAAEGSVS